MILTISIKRDDRADDERLTLSTYFNHKETGDLKRALSKIGYDITSLAAKSGWIK